MLQEKQLANNGLTPFEVYKKYIAIKLHFTSEKYDYFKSNGRSNATEVSFNRRGDYYFFCKLAKKYREYEIVDLFVSNFIANPTLWVGAIFGESSLEVYQQWQKRIESCSYSLKQDLAFARSYCQRTDILLTDLFSPSSGNCKFIQWIEAHKFNPESLCWLEANLDFLGSFRQKYPHDPLVQRYYSSMKKYIPFLRERLSTPPETFASIIEQALSN